MFCPKCGNQMADGSQFCPKCGTPVGAPAPQQAPQQPQYQQAPQQPQYQQPPRQPGYPPQAPYQPRVRRPVPARTRGQELLSLAFATVAFILMFIPSIRVRGTGGLSVLSTQWFGDEGIDIALFGVAKIFMIIAAVVYFGNVAISFMRINVPAGVKRLAPLCFYAINLFAQLFVFIACCTEKYVTMGSAWYLMIVALAFALMYELVPGLFKVEK